MQNANQVRTISTKIQRLDKGRRKIIAGRARVPKTRRDRARARTYTIRDPKLVNLTRLFIICHSHTDYERRDTTLHNVAIFSLKLE